MRSIRSLTGSVHNKFLVNTAPCSHLLKFYETDEELLDVLEQFVVIGLGSREACIIIATDDHRCALRSRLAARGIDIEQQAYEGCFIDLDARETLGLFMRNQWPDSERFETVIRGVIMSARGDGRSVRAFGEMVSLLWRDECEDAAIRLEYLWNNIIPAEDLSLFCAYPAEVCESSEFVHNIQVAHSGMVP
jgi:hypothetical protein